MIYKPWLLMAHVLMVVLFDDLRLIFSNLNVAVNGARWYSGDFYASSYLLHFCPNQPLCIQCFLSEHHKLKCGEVVMELKSRHYNFIMNHHEFNTFLTFKFVRYLSHFKQVKTHSISSTTKHVWDETRSGGFEPCLRNLLFIDIYQDNVYRNTSHILII